MLYFIGSAKNRVDAKGRVSLPSDFRKVYERVGSNYAILVPQLRDKRAIEGFTEAGFDDLLSQIARNDWSASDKAKVTRHIAGGAKPVLIDPNGRIVIPDAMRDAVGIGEEALFVSAAGTFEIWDPVTYEAASGTSTDETESLIAGMPWNVSNG